MAVATNTLKPQLLVLKKGEYVFEEGDEAIFAYVLTEGVIEIVAIIKGEELVLGKVEKGTVFGEMAIIDGFPRSASARAANDCKVQEVDHKEFLNYISKKPDAAFQIMGRLSGFVSTCCTLNTTLVLINFSNNNLKLLINSSFVLVIKTFTPFSDRNKSGAVTV